MTANDCTRCGLVLPPGACHINADACVEALRHALTCYSCHDPVPVVYCPACLLREAGKRALASGAGRVLPGALEWLQGLGGGGEGGSSGGGGKMFRP